MMKATSYILAVCFWLSPGLYAQAPEQDPADDQQEQTAETVDSEGENQVDAPEALPDIGLIEEEGKVTEGDENFVPSVRITEDLPVAFPVDI